MTMTTSDAASVSRTRTHHALRVATLTSVAAVGAVACSSANDEHASREPVAVDTAAEGAAAGNCAPRPPIYWQTHTDGWPASSLTLGGTRYPEETLVEILRSPLDDDASIFLARQLIAAMLDIASGTDPGPVTATIADANDLLASGAIPLGVPIFSPRGLRMLEDAAVLADFTAGLLTRACAAPAGACEAWSAVSVLPIGRDVVSYVAKGNWFPSTTTGISVVGVEGTRVVPTLVPTPEVVNTCASDPFTGRTVCTANGTDVYVLSGTTLQTTLTSSGGGVLSYGCTNCGVTMDAIHGRALLGLAFEAGGMQAGGYQFLDLGSSPSFEPPFQSAIPFNDTNAISTGVLVDPYRNLLLSPSERGLFEIVNVKTSTSPEAFLQQPTSETESAGEDCSTGMFVGAEGAFLGPPPALRYHMTDLSQATFTPGTPGSWSSTFAFYVHPDAPNGGWGAVAVAQGTHTGIFAGEDIESDNIVAFTLPATSGSTPALVDSVACSIPILATGRQPQGTTAYKSPNGGDAMALVVSFDASQMAVIDLTRMLDPTLVPRTADGHGCAAGSLPPTVVRVVAVP